MKVAGLMIPLLISAAVQGCTQDRKSTGIADGRLMPCPDSPNCVSTFADDKRHRIEPLTYSISRNEARDIILQIVQSMKRTEIVSSNENYIHALFRSKIFRFTDDVEFLFPEDEKVIHIRSASRTGYSDMGVNRKRIDSIKHMFYHKVNLKEGPSR